MLWKAAVGLCRPKMPSSCVKNDLVVRTCFSRAKSELALTGPYGPTSFFRVPCLGVVLKGTKRNQLFMVFPGFDANEVDPI